MKPKPNEISLPSYVKRCRIDLTERRKAAQLPDTMMPKETEFLEANVASALDTALSASALIEARERALRETLRELKKHRHALRAPENPADATDAQQGQSVE